MNIKKTKNKNDKNLNIILIFVFSTLVCSLTILFLLVFKGKSSTYTIKDSIKNIGVTTVCKGEKNSIKYDIKFPYFKSNDIDKVIRENLKNELLLYIKQKEHPSKFQTDYNSYSFNNNNGISIDLRLFKKSKGEKKEEVKTFVFCYGKKLTAENIFAFNKIKQVISAIKNEIRSDKRLSKLIEKEDVNIDAKLPNNINTLKNFIVKEDSIAFYFNSGEILPEKYGVISVDIPNTALKETFSKVYYKINPKEDLTQGVNLQKSKQPLVALTFDDGPKKETTNKILDTLEKYDAQATFFVLGSMAKQSPEILKRQAANGHEIANHSFSHPALTNISEPKIKKEIRDTNTIIEEATQIRPKLVRPPFGSINSKVKKTVEYPLICWNIDTKDWQTHSSKKTVQTVLKNIKDGDIVLMHDINESTVKAVENLVPELINRGFCLVTVSDMFKLKNQSLEKGHVYSDARNSEKT